jgi:hypothetical protein
MRGYLTGHETGAAASSATAQTIRDLQADAWNLGYTAGQHDATTEHVHNIAQTISDLAARYADIDIGFKQLAHATREQRIAREVADMQAAADRTHTATGTQSWAGLEHGAELPSADWMLDTTELTRNAVLALTAAPTDQHATRAAA